MRVGLMSDFRRSTTWCSPKNWSWNPGKQSILHSYLYAMKRRGQQKGQDSLAPSDFPSIGVGNGKDQGNKCTWSFFKEQDLWLARVTCHFFLHLIGQNFITWPHLATRKSGKWSLYQATRCPANYLEHVVRYN